MPKYPEEKNLDLPKIGQDLLDKWRAEGTFERSVSEREGCPDFVFYEGPPSANGLPGIHHMMARTVKDLFCRYKTLKGFRVERKAGWDTHGLPVELGVEKELGITKEDIGKSISVEDYNRACREAVMRYTDKWNNLTERMGYWVDMDTPYITYENKYIESVWWILKDLYQKDLIYKGYTIQPYSPKAGTGLSTHELNQPGTYRDVKDTTVIAQFKAIRDGRSEFIFEQTELEVFFLAWTTTPWTLPSNTALTVGRDIKYSLIETFNQYTGLPIAVVLASNLIGKYFKPENEALEFQLYQLGAKEIPHKVITEFTGAQLLDIRFEQLMPYASPMNDADKAFRIIAGQFVTTEDGTGIVHTAPTFGADDAMVAKAAGVPPLLVEDADGNPTPLVDLQGRFIAQMGEFAGRYVKNEYYEPEETPDKSVDVEIAIKLKEENKAFKVEKYEHSYPHCWRTDKPILYYPLDSWFVKTTKVKEELIENNKKINWKPESTGSGRFGNWLENLQDWNLSRSRYWGIPIPIWMSEDGTERKVIGSVEELKTEVEKAISKGIQQNNPFEKFEIGNMDSANYELFDLHKHVVDDLTLISDSGKELRRESDLIDVWFDSGSMPYAQWHYPFENKEKFQKSFPADFIAEGVDQTRGWFFTLHAISTMTQGSVAFKNVVSNGLVLDKNGQKMSKRLGNAVDPFITMDDFGSDATRWYMITNAQPWDNLKFDTEGIIEVQRKFFRALHNTYSFFALYANVDGFSCEEKVVPVGDRPEIDRWILSKLNSLQLAVGRAYDEYEPTKAGRLIQDFVVDDLSNWWVRLCRKRFWRGDYSEDKIAAYQTLHTCLSVIAQLASPIAPFYTDKLYRDLYPEKQNSVHLSFLADGDKNQIDKDLEVRMDLAQKTSSLVLALRKKENIKVRQPLAKILIPVKNDSFQSDLEAVKDLIINEVNIKDIEYISPSDSLLVKEIKPDFKALGPKFGKNMKEVARLISNWDQAEINDLEKNGVIDIKIDESPYQIEVGDVNISFKDVPGWLVASNDDVTVALDVQITEALKSEGIARELVNRIQNLRKDSGFEVTDRIEIKLLNGELIESSTNKNLEYIRAETLADRLTLVDANEMKAGIEVELDVDLKTVLEIKKV
ncbi:MAG: isoleucine--tRNA ligase [Flavobacteriales bacterium]|nr:isoleucine--tRNA ligase [Flavobacteriales bacterium]